MIGINKEELYDYLMNNHEIEFEFNSNNYIIQPAENDNKNYLLIFDMTNNCKICEIDTDYEISKEKINNLLNIPCFDNKSFIQIEKEIKVNLIK